MRAVFVPGHPLLLLTLTLAAAPVFAARKPIPPVPLGVQPPVVAVWQAVQGWGATPRLWIAIWSDGRVLHAPNPHRWGDQLREGRIPIERVAQLSKDIAATGIFDLAQPHFAGVPDGPVDHILVDLGKRRALLAWDEVESPNYGDNIAPTPGYLKLKACWKAVNRLALDARPKESRAIKGAFEPPRAWYQAPQPR